MSIEFVKIPIDHSQDIIGLKKFWLNIYHILKSRENYFCKIWENGTNTEIFLELIFCILTPQSKATLCWQAVKNIDQLYSKYMTIKEKDILKAIKHIRFHNAKAKYIMEAKKLFIVNNILDVRAKVVNNIYSTREWLVNNVKGLGYKESSHFLRNIGIGRELAILDRHILCNLRLYNIIDVIPQYLTKKTYLTIENKMQNFAKKLNIPMCHLDMILWSKSTGGIFK
jgi:N-glycosylase/DNA lyase